MNGRSLVAVYELRGDAERVRDRLMQLGIPATDIRLSADAASGQAPVIDTRGELPEEQRRGGGFWDWLFGEDIPEHDQSWYETHLREGRTVVSVLVRDDAEVDRVTDVLEEFDPIDFDQTAAMSTVKPGIAGSAAPVTAGPVVDRDIVHRDVTEREPGFVSPGARASAPLGEARSAAAGTRGMGVEGDQVIPVVKEELNIGKRVSERRYRIRTYVVERPVEEAVTLRDERVVIEHRPVAGERTVGDAELPREREYKVIERHEEPVVAKQARRVEDVVIRKEADEHTETVRDTVRETKVDVDKEATEHAEDLPRRNP